MLATLIESARAAYRRGAWDDAIAAYETALTLVPEADDPATRADLLRHLGSVLRDRGELDAALERYEASLALAERAELPDRVAAGLNVVAGVHMRRGGHVLATELFLRAREIAEAAGDDHLTAMVDQNLGVLANIQGQVAVALLSYRSALERYRRIGDEATACGALTNMGMAHVDLGEWEAAAACYREAGEIAERLGDAMRTGLVALNVTELHLRRRRYDDARVSCDRALQIFQRLRCKPAIGEAYKYCGILYRETAQPEPADTHFALSLGLAEAAQDRLLQAETQLEWAILHLEEERRQEGILRMNRALAIFRELQAGREVLDVERRIQRLQELYLPAVQQWGAARAERKDAFQTGHAQRVADYSTRLARELGVEGWELTWLRIGALLHDIGHEALPAEVLLKAEALSPEERELIQVHTIMGEALVGQLDFPEEVRPVIRNHHEHWAGTGYPDRLAGERIPFAARIVSVADVYDSLTSPRSFRPAHSSAEALRIMEHDCPGMFDPALFGVFRKMLMAGDFEVVRAGAGAGASESAAAAASRAG
jgi:putative nucleotidyltransferase with HDIG domain